MRLRSDFGIYFSRIRGADYLSNVHEHRLQNMQYRNEIDGLRAVAVISVILFHAGFPSVSGGYVGVDIFFVISGYLITGIVRREIAEGRFSFQQFYMRRARRILPALFLVLAATIPFAWMWLLPHAFRDYSQSLLASVLSYANIHFWTKSGYFQSEAELEPLLHIWSLAVEEQFYLLLPVLLLLLFRTGRERAVPLVLSVLAVASLILCEVLVRQYPDANFYLLPSRMWELLAGSLLSLLPAAGRKRRNGALAFLGLFMVGTSILLFDSNTPFPSVFALLPVIGTCLILHFAKEGTGAAWFLRRSPLVFVGRISYSAYLWHQPVFAFARIRAPEEPGAWMMSLLIGLSICLASLSWRFVEQPFRRRGTSTRQPSRYFPLGAALVGIGLCLLGVLGNTNRGFPWRLPPDLQDFEKEYAFSKNCLVNRKMEIPVFPNKKCIFNEGNKRKYVLWGDSIASSIAPGLANMLNGKGIALEQMTLAGCAPIVDVAQQDSSTAKMCLEFNRQVLSRISSSGADTVVLVAAWKGLFQSQNFLIGDQMEIVRDDDGRQRVVALLDSTIRLLQEHGLHVVLVYPTLVAERYITQVVAGYRVRGIDDLDLTRSASEFRAEVASVGRLLDSAGSPSLTRVDPNKAYCDDHPTGVCFLASGGRPVLADPIHFSPFGAKLVASAIMRQMGFDLQEPATERLPFERARSPGAGADNF